MLAGLIPQGQVSAAQNVPVASDLPILESVKVRACPHSEVALLTSSLGSLFAWMLVLQLVAMQDLRSRTTGVYK